MVTFSHQTPPCHILCPSTAISKEKKLKKAPEGLPDEHVKIPSADLAPEVVGSKEWGFD